MGERHRPDPRAPRHGGQTVTYLPFVIEFGISPHEPVVVEHADWYPRFCATPHWVEPGQPSTLYGMATLFDVHDDRSSSERELIRHRSNYTKMLNTQHRLRAEVLEQPR
jgi:hypothetical protein